MKFNTQKVALTGAIFAGLGMLLLSIANALGIYEGAVNMMQQWHMFYTPTIVGTITGIIEAAIITYVSILIVVGIYSLLGGDSKK